MAKVIIRFYPFWPDINSNGQNLSRFLFLSFLNKIIGILENHSESLSFSLSLQEKRGKKERDSEWLSRMQIYFFKKPGLCIPALKLLCALTVLIASILVLKIIRFFAMIFSLDSRGIFYFWGGIEGKGHKYFHQGQKYTF